MTPHTLPPRPTDEQLAEYFSGECSDATRSLVEQWQNAQEEHTTELELLGRVWERTRRPARSAETSRFVGRVTEQIVSQKGSRTRVQESVRERMFARQTLRGVLAEVAIVLSLSIVLMVILHDHPRTTERTYTTARGEYMTVTLPDRSRVVLAPQGRLVVARDFGMRTRAVVLEGQAYFDVTTGVQAPFTVEIGHLQVRVLGTQFDVRHYPMDSTTQVSVMTGKVVVTSPRVRIALAAGNVAQVTDSTSIITSSNGAKAYADWTQGRLVFDGTPASVMLMTLGRWYGYDFRLTDSALAREPVKAEFRVGAFHEAMTILKHVLNVSLTVDGKVVTLRAQHDSPPADVRRDHLLSPHVEAVGK